MTQGNDRLDRVEAILVQLADSQQTSNERLTRIETAIERIEAAIEADQRQAELDRQQAAEESQQLRGNLATLNEITIDFMGFTREAFTRIDQTISRLDQTIARLDQTVAELRAANQRQERINDFLLRDRGLNGG